MGQPQPRAGRVEGHKEGGARAQRWRGEGGRGVKGCRSAGPEESGERGGEEPKGYSGGGAEGYRGRGCAENGTRRPPAPAPIISKRQWQPTAGRDEVQRAQKVIWRHHRPTQHLLPGRALPSTPAAEEARQDRTQGSYPVTHRKKLSPKLHTQQRYLLKMQVRSRIQNI